MDEDRSPIWLAVRFGTVALTSAGSYGCTIGGELAYRPLETPDGLTFVPGHWPVQETARCLMLEKIFGENESEWPRAIIAEIWGDADYFDEIPF